MKKLIAIMSLKPTMAFSLLTCFSSTEPSVKATAYLNRRTRAVSRCASGSFVVPGRKASNLRRGGDYTDTSPRTMSLQARPL